MRLDKFLKVSRLIKRRTVANEVSDNGRVLVNGNPAKPAKQIKDNNLFVLFLYFCLGGLIADLISACANSLNLFSEIPENSGLIKNNAFSKYPLLVSSISSTCLLIPFIIKIPP